MGTGCWSHALQALAQGSNNASGIVQESSQRSLICAFLKKLGEGGYRAAKKRLLHNDGDGVNLGPSQFVCSVARRCIALHQRTEAPPGPWFAKFIYVQGS